MAVKMVRGLQHWPMRRGQVSWVCSACSGESKKVIVQGRISLHSSAFLRRAIEKRGKLRQICVQQKDNRQQSTLAVRAIPAGYGSSQALEQVS